MIKKLLTSLLNPVKPGKDKCICGPSCQELGCPAYKEEKCYWHPKNDPYGLKDMEWRDGIFQKKLPQ
jgi:hypothetical protein